VILLAGDIGGTKTWLRLARREDNRLTVLHERRYPSADYADFDTLLEIFLADAAQAGRVMPEVGCIGVAGPIEDGPGDMTCAKVTNLPWWLDSEALQQRFGLRRLRLINDFQAVGYGIEALGDDELVMLQVGAPRPCAPRVLIGAGTGLGQGILVWHGSEHDGHYEVLSSEGGHGDFAPGNAEQRELLCYLADRQPRVSVEDVLSGRGLVNVYRYLASRFPDTADEALARAMAAGDAAATVSEAALSGCDALAGRALDLFVAIYGTQAGNLALTCLASGGVYIAGGVAPRIRACLLAGPFLAAFRDKGPMAPLMKTLPVSLVLNSQVGLKGAARVAGRL
jgi:glucokinase